MIFEGSANGMKMSKGRIGRRVLGLAVAGVALAASGTAFAELGQPSLWEYRLQPSASPVMDNITSFHNALLIIITVITLFVLGLLITVMVKFNAKSNPVPSRTTHNTLVEVAWTLIPVLILVGISVKSFQLLFLELDIPKADVTLKATGNQWNWTYTYPDDKIEFTSISMNPDDLALHLLRRDIILGPVGYGIPGRRQPVFSDRFVCVVAATNPRLRQGALSLADLSRLLARASSATGTWLRCAMLIRVSPRLTT